MKTTWELNSWPKRFLVEEAKDAGLLPRDIVVDDVRYVSIDGGPIQIEFVIESDAKARLRHS